MIFKSVEMLIMIIVFINMKELKEKIESFAKEVTKRQDITSANINKRRYQLTSLKVRSN